MVDCCSNGLVTAKEMVRECPSCEGIGKAVKIITVKAMLKPLSLENLNGNANHSFCSNEKCDVVYFDTNNKTYVKSDVKVPVFQKENSRTVPVCYCFNWTKEKIIEYTELGQGTKPLEHIKENTKANRCGCEVNNPQGSCCLGNVTQYIKSLPN
ncbi:(2Fe-2S)-binding protein [Evansella sp. AB-P1]|uniref:putative iron-sulfur cluster-binding metallochaperone n=1 Tax=Evansella sp. AB-P1 TaxID=3037653 RepID=UPI00241CC03D|nr:(2Fe-2S)-binding protein [Evansella sp. AB-P1]MDG5789272.1 (2Fe-2S)-binding protein [Evansella sp. AB-P1]